MFGLVMHEEYLLGILNGEKQNDVRLYSTTIRGRIALVKSKSNLIYGYANLVDVERITYEEYILWHVYKNYSKEQAQQEILRNQESSNKISKTYKYILENVEILAVPIKINAYTKKGSWIEFSPDSLNIGYKQETLEL